MRFMRNVIGIETIVYFGIISNYGHTAYVEMISYKLDDRGATPDGDKCSSLLFATWSIPGSPRQWVEVTHSRG
jgi:hypothetical protein